MRKVLAIALLFAAGCSAVTRRAESTPRGAPSSFSMVITSTTTGWAAHCDTGCRWSDVSYECPGQCAAVFDATGVATPGATQTDTSVFAFTIERTEQGNLATAQNGAAWQQLTWGCGAAECRARVSTDGVRLGSLRE
jgi:hypothetical protein